MEIRGTPGLILPGGGARAAYQVGVLKALAAVLDRDQLPFTAVAGISAGSINATAVAQHAEDFVGAVQRLEGLWANMTSSDVFEVDLGNLRALFSKEGQPLSLFDNTPLGNIVRRELDAPALQQVIASGLLRGLAVTASNCTTGEATTFIQARSDAQTWHHDRRDSVLTVLGSEHLLASSALPLLFPAQRVGDEFFVDGSLRMTAPLSPVINLGADRILVIGVRYESRAGTIGEIHAPGIAEIGGYTLESLFAENLNADIERAHQVNAMLELIPWWRRRQLKRRRIEVMVIRPSQDVRTIAARYSMKLPRTIRLFLRTLGGWGNEWRLPSYLLFEAPFTQALIDLGYRDGLKHRPALEAFFSKE